MTAEFRRDELRNRYDVDSIEEDPWHTYTGLRTASLLANVLPGIGLSGVRVLNAGAGVYAIPVPSEDQFFVDLFAAPMKGRKNAVCASIEQLPFGEAVFECVVCVGEVLSYCDPAAALREFARILSPKGHLVFDFGSTHSIVHWRTDLFGRAADILTDQYNGSSEKVWRYSPSYIRGLLEANGFGIRQTHGIHTWSAVAKRLGANEARALMVQRWLEMVRLPSAWADVLTIVAVKETSAR
ncbi:methyltransferase domain-containing protein [Bradyrhizobium sp. B120]|uniref:methyltransferase domain-containing protein n=1 Tax=Bradyrhizobium sp. B120 TaxID=3410088 RepID=UPI003B98583B